MKRYLLFLGIGLGVSFLTMLSVESLPLNAQSPAHWSIPQRIRGIADESDPPILVADRNRTVHAFYSQWIGGDLAVFYNQLSPTTGWTTPSDVLLSPDSHQATVVSAFLDPMGMFHLIFFGGTAEKAEIYYSTAPALKAGQPRVWSAPRMVGDGATAPASGSLVGDDKGNLFIVYSGNRDGYGVYAIKSRDQGATWSDPTPVFFTQSNGQFTCCIRAYLDERGELHAIWGVLSKAGQGRGIFYAKMNMSDGEWRLPVNLADSPTGLGVLSPTLIEHNGLVFAAFYDADLGGHYVMRISRDNGETWEKAIIPFARHIGANGAGSFVLDANDTLHLFWGQRIPGSQGTSAIHGMWHSTWQDDQGWSEPEAVVSGPPSVDFDPSSPRAVVAQGNLLVVTWRNDPGPDKVPIGVWYSSTTLTAPELALATLQAPAATLTPTSIALTITPVPSPTSLLRKGFTSKAGGIQPLSSDGNPTLTVLAAILPVILLLGIVVAARNLWRA